MDIDSCCFQLCYLLRFVALDSGLPALFLELFSPGFFSELLKVKRPCNIQPLIPGLHARSSEIVHFSFTSCGQPQLLIDLMIYCGLDDVNHQCRTQGKITLTDKSCADTLIPEGQKLN